MKYSKLEASSRTGRQITRPESLRSRMEMNNDKIHEEDNSLNDVDWKKISDEFKMIGIEIRNNDHIIGPHLQADFEKIIMAARARNANRIVNIISSLADKDARISLKKSIATAIGLKKTKSAFGYNIPLNAYNPSKRRVDFTQDDKPTGGPDGILADLKKRAGIT